MALARSRIAAIVRTVNEYLRGDHHEQIRDIISKDGTPTSWLAYLEHNKRPEKTDGKSLGTMIEKLVKAEISRVTRIKITGSSAAGVDIPELALNTKATSDRQPQSSEPFDSPYERVLGAKYDILACVYNGLEFLQPDSTAPLRINAAMYYLKTQVADRELCSTAKILQAEAKEGGINPDLGKRALRAIVYAKKSGPGSGTYKLLKAALAEHQGIRVEAAIDSYEMEMETDGEIGLPKPDEWRRFLSSPLDGKISISFALQWRYQYDPAERSVRCF